MKKVYLRYLLFNTNPYKQQLNPGNIVKSYALRQVLDDLREAGQLRG